MGDFRVDGANGLGLALLLEDGTREGLEGCDTIARVAPHNLDGFLGRAREQRLINRQVVGLVHRGVLKRGLKVLNAAGLKLSTAPWNLSKNSLPSSNRLGA